jgi:hypothetical protein
MNPHQSFVKADIDPLSKITHNKGFVTELVNNGLDWRKVRHILHDRHLTTPDIRIIQKDKKDLDTARRWLTSLSKNKWLLPEEKGAIENIRKRLNEWHERTVNLEKTVWKSLCNAGGINPDHLCFFTPKTKGSARQIDLSPMAAKALAEWKLKSSGKDDNLVFSNEAGGPDELQQHGATALQKSPEGCRNPSDQVS